MLLSRISRQATNDAEGTDGEAVGAKDAGKLAVGRALAARDHAAFSAMVYAGLRIEETTALTLEDLSFARELRQGEVRRIALPRTLVNKSFTVGKHLTAPRRTSVRR